MKWFDELRQDNAALLAAAKKAKAERFLRRSAVEKYAEATHFIFELLQNADDQEAKKVRFTLSPDRAEFYHWGKPFKRGDVERITRLGDSDKPNEVHKIGSFGIGFKSVFAVTDRPEVYCELDCQPFAFAIEDIIVPVNLPPAPGQGAETRFVLPYAKKEGADRSSEAVAQLKKTGPEVLMFLNHIEELIWEDSSGKGERCRCTRGADGITLFERSEFGAGSQMSTSAYRLFRQSVTLPDGRPSEACLAFRLNDDGKAVGENGPAKLWVYFETEEQIGFRLRVHGPFKLTDSRANIMRNEPFNRQLINDLSALAATALTQLRDENRLVRETLNALPIPGDNIAESWTGFAESIWQTLRAEGVLPTAAGGYAKPGALWQGTQEFRSVLNDQDLTALADKEMSWTVSAGQRNSRIDRLLTHVGVEELLLDRLVKHLESGVQRPSGLDPWLASHEDAWLQSLYLLLNDAKGYLLMRLSYLPIVRTADSKHLRASQVRFAPANDGASPDIEVHGVSLVAAGVLAGRKQVREEIEQFLRRIEVKDVDEEDYIRALVAQHYQPDGRVADMKAHLRHIERFAAWLVAHPYQTATFQGASLFLAEDSDELHKGEGLYIDRPYHETGLAAVYGSEGPLANKKRPLAKRYRGTKGVLEFARALGVVQNLQPSRSSTKDHPEKRDLWADYYGSGTRWGNATDVDWVIPDLQRLLVKPDVAVSLCVWRTLQALDRSFFFAKFRHAESYSLREKPASFVYQLKAFAWIPCASGGFRKPADITEAELPGEFDDTDRTGWLGVIGLGTAARRKAAEYQEERWAVIRAGIPSEFAERFQDLSDKQKHSVLEAGLRHLDTSASSLPEFPERDAPNPQRRSGKVAEAAEGADEKRREERERTVRVEPPGHRDSTRTYLEDLYTNDDGVMVCQCCRNAMPFKLADGSYYFEAVQFDDSCDRELTWNYVALCPICAAKYQHARTTPGAGLRAALAKSDSEIPVTLAGKVESIKFVRVHKNDLLSAFGVLCPQGQDTS
jgi:hypothetical protein